MSAPNSRVRTSEAARLLTVPRSAITDWARADLIQPVGLVNAPGRKAKDPVTGEQYDGVAVYDLEALRPLAEAYHQRQTRRTDRT